MKLAEAYVDITARTGKFMRALSGIRKSLGNIMRVAAKMALAVVAAFAAMAYAAWRFAKIAMVQERAEKMLDATLRTTGQSVEKYGKQLRKAASEIQKSTVYGDEFILSLMAQGMNLGVAADKIEEVTKYAIGLATALQMDLATAMRYTTLATMGETTMLGRYIPALRGVTDQTKKWIIVQNAAIQGWNQAQEEIKTTQGAIEQLKNMWGDMAEMIGDVFLPIIRKATKYMMDNQNAIKKFVAKSVVHIKYFASVLKNFWKDTDFKSKWQVMIDSILIMLKAFVKAAVVLAVAAGKGIYVGVRKGIAGDIGGDISKKAQEIYEAKGGTYKKGRYGPGEWGLAAEKPGYFTAKSWAADKKKYDEAWNKAVEAINKELAKPIIGPAFKEVAKIMTESTTAIRETMDKELSTAGARAQQNLEIWRKGELAKIELAGIVEAFKNTRAWLKKITTPKPIDTIAFADTFKFMWKVIKQFGEKLIAPFMVPPKEKEKRAPEFRGLVEQWERIQLAAMGGISPEKIQQKQLTTQKKSEKHLEGIKKGFDWMMKVFTPGPVPLARG